MSGVFTFGRSVMYNLINIHAIRMAVFSCSRKAPYLWAAAVEHQFYLAGAPGLLGLGTEGEHLLPDPQAPQRASGGIGGDMARSFNYPSDNR